MNTLGVVVTRTRGLSARDKLVHLRHKVQELNLVDYSAHFNPISECHTQHI